MSGMTLNDWDETVQAKRFSSYDDNWEITGSGQYDLSQVAVNEEDEENMGQIMEEYQRQLTREINPDELNFEEETKDPGCKYFDLSESHSRMIWSKLKCWQLQSHWA